LSVFERLLSKPIISIYFIGVTNMDHNKELFTMQNPRKPTRPVVIVSDNTGITAETLSHSLLSQFPDIKFVTEVLPFVVDEDRVFNAVDRINGLARDHASIPLVFVTLVVSKHRRLLETAQGVFFDLFDTFIAPLEEELEHDSNHSLGQSHGMTDIKRYSSRIGAINYSVHTDDGVNTTDYERAEVILTGVSRSGKTPTCLYLALHFGIFAANFPLTTDELDIGKLPDALVKNRHRVFGLTIDPERLQQIRQERRSRGRYSDPKQCRFEVNQAEALFRRESIPHVNSTSMSIEEISAKILHRMQLHREFL
jgi:hypothetical protein